MVGRDLFAEVKHKKLALISVDSISSHIFEFSKFTCMGGGLYERSLLKIFSSRMGAYLSRDSGAYC